MSEAYPRDLLGYERKPPKASWPRGARIALQLVLNYEEGGESSILHGDKASEAFLSEIVAAQPLEGVRHMSMESLYEYGSRVGVWRLLELFRRHDVPLTVFGVAMALERNPDVRAPSRSLDIHLTGNMERFMWSFDGVKMSDMMEPIPFLEGERVRINLINDSMMGHPIHIHGHFFELVTGHGDHAPRKHTVIVQPGGKVTWDFTADAVGDWAFHCHLLYHMHAGMMRTVSVRPRGDAA